MAANPKGIMLEKKYEDTEADFETVSKGKKITLRTTILILFMVQK